MAPKTITIVIEPGQQPVTPPKVAEAFIKVSQPQVETVQIDGKFYTVYTWPIVPPPHSPAPPPSTP